MSGNLTVEEALKIATKGHVGQLDKAGRPYVEHPIRVAARVDGTDAKIVALLHDTLEDTWWTSGQLRAAGVNETQLEAILALTKIRGETLKMAMIRCRANPLALIVKLADVADNLDSTRLALLDDATRVRLMEKYRKTLLYLNETAE